MSAAFNAKDHCTVAGWATYGHPQSLRQRLCELLGGHRTDRPTPNNDYCPQAYTRCKRCDAWLRWFNPGTHRFGSISDWKLR